MINSILSNKKRRISLLVVIIFMITLMPVFAATPKILPILGVQASSTIGGNMSPENLINGNKNDMFSSQSDANCWIYAELDGIYDVSGVTLYSRGDKYGFPEGVKISTSIDGIDWTPVPNAVYTFPNPILEISNKLDFAAPVTAKFVRIETTKAFWDGVSSLTQYSEIEIFGSDSSFVGDSTLQTYKLKRISNTNSKWYQFEDVGITAQYPSKAFFIPFYKTPIAGDTLTKAPNAIFYNNKYLLAYEKGGENSSQIYAKMSFDEQIDKNYNAEFLLINKSGFDCIKNPSFVKIADKTYIAVETIKKGSSKIAIIEYKGQSNITITNNDIIKLNVSVDGFSGNMSRPSLTYDESSNTLRLYFVSKIDNKPVMFYAEANGVDFKDLVYKNYLNNLNYGTVFHSAGGYFALFKTYNDDGSCLTEWASSQDGIIFERESILVCGNTILNGKQFSTGTASAVMDDDGNIKAVFAQTWFDNEADSSIMMALPQMRVSISNGYVTLQRTMALSSSVQIIIAERNYTSSDLVKIYDFPSDSVVYEVRQNISSGSAYQVMPINSKETARTSCYKIQNPSLSDLSWIKPKGIEGNAYAPVYTPSNLIAYDENLVWQTVPVYTFNPNAEEFIVTLPSELNVGAISIAGFDGGGFPEAFNIQYSTDNVNFMQVSNGKILDFPTMATKDDVVFKFDSVVLAKYIKFQMTRFTPNGFFMVQAILSKIKIYGQNIPEQYVYAPEKIIRGYAQTWNYKDGKTLQKIAPIQSIRVSSELNSTNWKGGNLIDGDTVNTLWSSASDQTGAEGQFIIADLGSSYNVGRIELFPRGDALCFPKAFYFSYSKDGISWTQITGQNYTDYPVPNPALHQYFKFNAPVSARYIKMNIEKQRSDGGNYMSHIAEFSVHKVVD